MIHTRNGYNFLITVQVLSRPIGPFKFAAKVERTVRHGLRRTI